MLKRKEVAPLEEQFREWLRRRKLLSQSTVEAHLARLRRSIAENGMRIFLTSAVADKSIRQTQIYYKEFLCEYFLPMLLPLLQQYEEWNPMTANKTENLKYPYNEGGNGGR